MVLSEEAIIQIRELFIDLDNRKIANFDSEIGLLGLILEEPAPTKK